MSFLRNKPELSIMMNVTLSRKAANQMEVIRRAFEQPTPELLASILEQGIQEEFDRRMAEIGVLPGLDVESEAEEAA